VDCAHLHAIGPCGNEALWVAEQVLRSATCALVACWPRQANDRQLRRLQLAAEAGRAIGIAFRPARAAALTSPAAVRLHADAAGIAILKCRGGHVHTQRVPIEEPAINRRERRQIAPRRSAGSGVYTPVHEHSEHRRSAIVPSAAG
jgi:hypothetical protein